jgi:transposase
MDQIVAVRVPSADEEAARDLVRAREDARGDLMRTRHRLSKLLPRQGVVWSGGAAWTGRHELRPRGQHFDRIGTQLAFDADLRGDAAHLGARECIMVRERCCHGFGRWV